VVNGHLGTWRELYVVIRGKALWMRARGSKDGESRYELWYMCMVLSWNWYVVDLELQILAWDWRRARPPAKTSPIVVASLRLSAIDAPTTTQPSRVANTRSFDHAADISMPCAGLFQAQPGRVQATLQLR
jgi:hypothetical protein